MVFGGIVWPTILKFKLDSSNWNDVFDPFKDIESAMEPLFTQIADVEKDIESIVGRNSVVDEEIKRMKNDFVSLADKILSIKVSFICSESVQNMIEQMVFTYLRRT